MKTILVTGGCGFIGSNFVRMILSERKEFSIINIDKLTYAGNINNLKEYWDNPNWMFYKVDICNKNEVLEVFKNEDIDYVVNFAAESHVDRSIENPDIFLQTNIIGTNNLIKASQKFDVERFIQISTDEVYGSLNRDEPAFTERSNISPNNPYSASKAAADLLLRSYINTYKFPGIITRCSNNFGPFQFPEKFIPVIITNALKNQDIPVYGKGENIRDWIHVSDHCNGILKCLEKGERGEIYNFGGNSEISNLELVRLILKIMDKPLELIKHVENRKGHDFRYAMNFKKVKEELNWVPKINFMDGLKNTIKWYLDNQNWIQSIKSGEYRNSYTNFQEKTSPSKKLKI